jgi:putative SOS response-associated peptidase YedK
MCGRYKRKGDKQRIAEAFHIDGSLQETDFDEDEDCVTGSIQPVVRVNHYGERDLTLMRQLVRSGFLADSA